MGGYIWVGIYYRKCYEGIDIYYPGLKSINDAKYRTGPDRDLCVCVFVNGSEAWCASLETPIKNRKYRTGLHRNLGEKYCLRQAAAETARRSPNGCMDVIISISMYLHTYIYAYIYIYIL